jgi:myo-inositol-1(or 4)-monophosphatase
MTRPLDVERLLAVALEAARDAAALVHQGWRTRPAVETKASRVDLVTRWDEASERLLTDRLRAQTGIAVVAEESGGEAAPEGEPTFYVDPLDGTTNFVHGHPFYCVSIGLVTGREPVLGAVVAPALGVEWAGIASGASRRATRNGEACRVSEVARLTDALLATGFPYDRATSPDNNFGEFVAIKKKAQGVRRCGAAAMDLCLVGDGTYDGYWERKLKPWDLAAGAAIVLGAGGAISAFDGGPADVRTGHIVATNGKIHGALVGELATSSAGTGRARS